MAALFKRKGAAAINGPDSIPYRIYHANGWPNEKAVWPKVAGKECNTAVLEGKDVWHVIPAKINGKWKTAKFNGSTTISWHGTGKRRKDKRYARGLDALQLEQNYSSKTGFAFPKDDPRRKALTRKDGLNEKLAVAYLDVLVDAILHGLKVNYDWKPAKTVPCVIVDNGAKGFVTKGKWVVSEGKGYWGTPSLYTAEKGAMAGWSAPLPSEGEWEVSVRHTVFGKRANNVPFTVLYSGGKKLVRVNQTSGGGKWRVLGTFAFGKSKPARVVLIREKVGESSNADAVRFRKITK